MLIIFKNISIGVIGTMFIAMFNTIFKKFTGETGEFFINALIIPWFCYILFKTVIELKKEN